MRVQPHRVTRQLLKGDSLGPAAAAQRFRTADARDRVGGRSVLAGTRRGSLGPSPAGGGSQGEALTASGDSAPSCCVLPAPSGGGHHVMPCPPRAARAVERTEAGPASSGAGAPTARSLCPWTARAPDVSASHVRDWASSPCPPWLPARVSPSGGRLLTLTALTPGPGKRHQSPDSRGTLPPTRPSRAPWVNP